VPGFCRLAIEAACIEAVRRRRLGRGQPHAEVEALLGSVHRLTGFASLALFDDPDKGGDVLPRIDSQYGKAAADAYQAANKGVHHGLDGNVEWFVDAAAKLANQLAERP
jgi:hypothetical protein